VGVLALPAVLPFQVPVIFLPVTDRALGVRLLPLRGRETLEIPIIIIIITVSVFPTKFVISLIHAPPVLLQGSGHLGAGLGGLCHVEDVSEGVLSHSREEGGHYRQTGVQFGGERGVVEVTQQREVLSGTLFETL